MLKNLNFEWCLIKGQKIKIPGKKMPGKIAENYFLFVRS